ncbi:hypothetical protein E2C01_031798 [Portunus trituberculatus]|uniref:Uncharacterized protein n=1 Tax=Portunus trituberculatus TaxID=210409 RepID=A0A5B7EUE2_PORTR|nr:hypothetical protein [Portunus trituberculatus]
MCPSIEGVKVPDTTNMKKNKEYNMNRDSSASYITVNQ